MSSSKRGFAHTKEWRKNNPEKLRAQRNRAADKRKLRRNTEPGFREKENVAAALRNAKHFRKTKIAHCATWYLKAARKRAVERNLPYDLDAHKEYYQSVLNAGTCQMTGLPFQRENNKQGPFTPTFDRIIPELGYVHGNVRVIIWALNRAIGEWGFDFLAYLVDRSRTTSK